jgi:hypothetical protein
MLTFITNPIHQLLQFIKDDPVRPDIPAEFRVSNGRTVVALAQEDKPSAMVCVSFHDFVPESVEDLDKVTEVPTTAVFYTIWSYKPGAGRDLLVQAVEEIKQRHPSVNRFVTLSPKTEMAKRFHLKNGAIIFRENTDTVNYEYLRK